MTMKHEQTIKELEDENNEACNICDRNISEVDYLINMHNGDCLCPECRTITNYNGGF
jgi:hypothetical protein